MTTPVKRRVVRRAKVAAAPVPEPPRKEPKTLGEEVDILVTEWYASLGQEVPPGELMGAEIDKQERELWDQIMGFKPPEPEVPLVKPDFGTPEFWAWARAQKAKKNAELVAKGLPPLPSKKELEAQKAAKAAAKAAAAAEKAALAAQKLAEKEAKAAAKAAKAAAKK